MIDKAPEPIAPDLEWLKSFIGGQVLELAQARGIALAAQASLAAAEKENEAKDKRIAEMEKPKA